MEFRADGGEANTGSHSQPSCYFARPAGSAATYPRLELSTLDLLKTGFSP